MGRVAVYRQTIVVHSTVYVTIKTGFQQPGVDNRAIFHLRAS